MASTNVVTYLTTRLQQLGVNHLFSVPGDYTSDLLEIVDTQTTLKRIGNCNELNAGYAADGYARINGLGAVAVTTGVGSFSLLNAIGGAFVEDVPVVAIIGTLSNTKALDEINGAELYHHNVGSGDANLQVYKPVTVAFEKISNPLTAPAQIDQALIACISQRKPVAIEITEDCYYMPCADPVGELSPVASYESIEILRQMAAATSNKYATQIVTALDGAAQSIYDKLCASKAPVLWIGKEIQTYHLQDKFLALLDKIKAPYAYSLLGKAIIPEDNPWFIGLHDGVFTSAYTNQFIQKSDCLIGLGVWNTDLNQFGVKSNNLGLISDIDVSRSMVKAGNELYVQVSLSNLLDALLALIDKNGYTPKWSTPVPPSAPVPPNASDPITYDGFYSVLDSFITPNHIIMADIGLSTFGGTSSLKITRPNGIQAQNIWASIGWSVPAGLGASFVDGTRALVIVGDGAFKLTCQAVSTMVMEKRNTVVFVMNNKVYGVEQMLLDPAPYKQDSTEPFEEANILQEWDYVSLMKAFSNNSPNGQSANVNTVQDLHNVLETINNNPNAAFLVNINLNERDYPSAWSLFVNK
ncbi:thiamine pyrophosphate-binding protein [Belliella aquatica]|uniref:Pyruvate decarboxylase n=1 Tax=Belliella aquatica TaxID=1323734 RepID=A0ABQ1LK17_9BACT|nr:thiamine pyrophosphate-binding protein [Belliella aquatica]MCH7404145.1 thiamine pyrophosphate-dependent enzyme [Belliella aquatica]GGC25697.1 pyruvate decarboxylase [Belliella aquatica]